MVTAQRNGRVEFDFGKNLPEDLRIVGRLARLEITDVIMDNGGACFTGANRLSAI